MTSQQFSLCRNVDRKCFRNNRHNFRWESAIQLFIHLRYGFPSAGKGVIWDSLRKLFTPSGDRSVDIELVDGNDCAKHQLCGRRVTHVVYRWLSSVLAFQGSSVQRTCFLEIRDVRFLRNEALSSLQIGSTNRSACKCAFHTIFSSVFGRRNDQCPFGNLCA